MKSKEEILQFIKGLVKKHGDRAEIVVKYQSDSGKVRRRHGRLLGLRQDAEVGVACEGRQGETWFAIERVRDVWKRGAPPG